MQGFQGNDQNSIPEDRIAACAKHFVGYSAAEGGRDYNTTEITPQTLHNIYLSPFKAAIQAGCATVMSAFHDIGGIPLSAHRYLLSDVLKDQWGFTGLLVSDWGAVGELINHGVAADRAHAAELACNAGVDMDMCSMVFLQNLPGLVRAGRVSEARLNDAVRRVLRLKFSLGLFENPYADPDASRAVHLAPASLATMRTVAASSMVLLKNNGVLPLGSDNVTLCLSGPLADERQALLGCWTPDGQAEEVTTLKEALAHRLGPQCQLHYCELWDDAVKLARASDVMILAIGESAGRSGEDNCTTTIDLPPGQEALVEAARRMEIPIVVVVFGGRALNLTRVADWADAVLFAWHPGTAGALGVADILFGDVNPSGRLPVTFPRSTGQIPLYYNHPPTGRPMNAGSRRHSRYVDSLDSPLFPFGFGLSYTTFEYSNLRALSAPQTAGITVSVEVANTGEQGRNNCCAMLCSRLCCRCGASGAGAERIRARLLSRQARRKPLSFVSARRNYPIWMTTAKQCLNPAVSRSGSAKTAMPNQAPSSSSPRMETWKVRGIKIAPPGKIESLYLNTIAGLSFRIPLIAG